MEISTTDIYSEIESAVTTQHRDRDITAYLKEVADATDSEKMKQKIKWEMAALDFVLDSGKALPVASTTKEDGTSIWEYPSLKDFDSNAYSYLQSRAEQAQSDLLIARYNTILWRINSKSKNQQQAKDAIDAYARFLDKLTSNTTEEENWSDKCLSAFKNACALAFEISYNTDQWKSRTHVLLFKTPAFDNIRKLQLVKFMLEHKQFKANHFDGVISLLEGHIEDTINEKDHFYANSILQEVIRVANKTGTDPKPYYKRIAENYLGIANHRSNDTTGMTPMVMYKNALDYFKKAGEKQRAKDTEKKYSQSKRNLKLANVQVPFDEQAIEALWDIYTKKAEKLVEREPEQILEYLTYGQGIFPEIDHIKEFSKKGLRSSFLDFAAHVELDMNKNIKPTSRSSDDAEFNSKLMESYDYYIRISVLPYLQFTFTKGIIADKLNFNIIMKFLVDHSWLGKTYEILDSGGNEDKHNWLSLVAPSIHEYYKQTKSALKSSNPFTNYILCIDSLTTKIEGIMRHFCQLSGGTTTVAGKQGKLREMYIEELIETPELKNAFDQNDRILFKYLFSSGAGLDVRTNVAHCFFRYKHYSLDIMHLLIVALLRLGKYNTNSHE